MTTKLRQWREDERARLKSLHWVGTNTGDGKLLFTFTGVAECDLKGADTGEWVHEEIMIGLALPVGLVPQGQALQIEHWAPFVTLNALYNKGNAIDAGWAVDEFSGPGPVAIKPNGRFRIRARISVRDLDGWLHRIGFSVTFSGYLVAA
jgi:hypothetical protein